MLAWAALAVLLSSCQDPGSIELKGTAQLYVVAEDYNHVELPFMKTGLYLTNTGLVFAPASNSSFAAVAGLCRYTLDSAAAVLDSGSCAITLFNDLSPSGEVRFNNEVIGHTGKDLGVVRLNDAHLSKDVHYVTLPGVAGEGSPRGFYYHSAMIPFAGMEGFAFAQNQVYFAEGMGFQTPVALTKVTVKPNSGQNTIVRDQPLRIQFQGSPFTPAWVQFLISTYDRNGRSVIMKRENQRAVLDRGSFTVDASTLGRLPADSRYFLFTFVSINSSVLTPRAGYSNDVLLYAASVYNVIVTIEPPPLPTGETRR